MDVLSDLLGAVRMRSAFFFDVTNYEPWVVGTPMIEALAHRVMPGYDYVVPFKVISEGSCWVELVGDPPLRYHLEAGDVVAFPRGDEHYVMSTPGMRTDPDHPEYDMPASGRRVLTHNVLERSAPVACRFICGFMGCSASPFNPLLGSLPRMFRARMSPESQSWLASLGLVGVAASTNEDDEYQTLVLNLAELMFVEVIRQYVKDQAQDAQGWVSGLRDPHVGAALRLMHARPAEAWTLDQLAQEVGLSRSVFAGRFTALVGMPAIQYLSRWRLTLAARLLDDPSVTITRAGAEVGYDSEAAFQRAFKKHTGMPPGEWRRSRDDRTASAGFVQL